MIMLDPSLYFDHSATTPPRSEVIQRMQEVMQTHWGNPSSLHGWGEQAATVLEIARQSVAQLLGCEPESIIFTSGGTESNNLALLGIALQYEHPQHLVISSIEHSSVENVARHLASQGWQISRLPVSREGLIDVGDLQKALRPNTAMVSILYGQNEIGSLQPIAQLAACCRAAGIPFHCDAVQVAGRIPLAMQELPVDLLSLSGHKLYGPQGVGSLYVRPGLRLLPILRGGGQENGIRSGTQPLPAIAGLGVAADWASQEVDGETMRLRGLQAQLRQALADCPALIPTGPLDGKHRLPHHLSYCVDGLSGTAIVQAMNRLGIGISAGSACNRGKLIPSRVLLAMGFSPEQALGSIRLSIGRTTTPEAVAQVAQALRQVIAQLLRDPPSPLGGDRVFSLLPADLRV
ncbi:MAG: cysteine desulfurase family protein [Cyanobacteriota bacterium]|nr:cysteine desulfurase family protein [Cyanobacteriota bacterium]